MSDSPYLKPLPAPDSESAPFWEACRRHELKLQRCTACGATRFPPHVRCPKCRSSSSAWIASTGRGRIYSWIVVRHPVPAEVYAPEVPYVVALVDLDDGVRMVANLVDCAPEEVAADMAVEVTFRDVTPEVTLPQFRPVRT